MEADSASSSPCWIQVCAERETAGSVQVFSKFVSCVERCQSEVLEVTTFSAHVQHFYLSVIFHTQWYTNPLGVLGPGALWWPSSFNMSLLNTKAPACRRLFLGDRNAAAVGGAASPGSGPGAGAGDRPAEETKRSTESAGANGRLHHLPGSTAGGGGPIDLSIYLSKHIMASLSSHSLLVTVFFFSLYSTWIRLMSDRIVYS